MSGVVSGRRSFVLAWRAQDGVIFYVRRQWLNRRWDARRVCPTAWSEDAQRFATREVAERELAIAREHWYSLPARVVPCVDRTELLEAVEGE